jgi:hypothetical protein
MADPIITPQLLAAVGAGAGALMKPRNPLQGALLGGIAGYTGGTALGAGAGVGGGTGLALGSGGASGLGAANAVGGTGLGEFAGGLGLQAPAATSGYALATPAATNAAMAPTFLERLGMAGQSAYENPMMTAQALQATQGLLTPDQQIHATPGQVSYSRGQGQPVDFNAALNPYKQTLPQNKPISLI